MAKLLSIICVTKDNKAELRETLDSVKSLLQNRKIELIIINAGHRITEQWFESYRQEKNVSLIEETDKGIYDGMNKGYRVASGLYIWFLNSGDTFLKNFTDAELENILVKDKDLYIYAHQNHEQGKVKKPKRLTRFNLFLYVTSIFNHQSVIVKKKLFNGFDLRFGLKAEYESYFDLLIKVSSVSYSNIPLAKFSLGGVGRANKGLFLCEIIRIQISKNPLFIVLSIPFFTKLICT